MQPLGSAAKEHRTVSRVVGILELVAASPHATRLQAIADTIGAPKTSTHVLVRGLVATGYLREHGGAYLLGPAVASLLGETDPPLLDVVRPHLVALRDAVGETTLLSRQVGASVVYLDMVESTQLIRYAAPLRQRRPIYPTSTGKCFLAHMPVARREALLGEFLTGPARLRAALAEIEQVALDGVAYNRGETVTDVSAAACLLRVPGREPWAVSVVGPTHRVEPRLPELADAVRAAAATTEAEFTPDIAPVH
ncbi:MAG: IclR family transcriptional regulator [Pseudonocardia sp.]|nr:IclR family transcriptional regulator [Pseudonocardia sp.]